MNPEEIRVIEDRRRRLWEIFSQGRWRRGSEWQPKLPGTYYVATADGESVRLLAHHTEQPACRIIRTDGLQPWLAWIWSEPLPPAPVPEPEEW